MSTEQSKDHSDSDFLLSFLVSRETLIQQNIQLADQKAQTLIAIDSAVIGALYSTDLLEDYSIHEILGVVASFILVIAVFVNVMVLVPRGAMLYGKLSNPMTFGKQTGTEYSSQLAHTDDREILMDLSLFVTSLARISALKYKFIPSAVKLSAAGWLITGAWVLSGVFR